MQPQEDEFPYTSDDPSLAPNETTDSSPVFSSQQVNDLKAVLRVAVGSTLNGSDLLMARVRRIQDMQQPGKSATIPIDENETSQDRLRYLLLGSLFEVPDVLQRWSASTGKTSSKIFNLFSRLTSPLTESWLFSPVKDRYDQAAARGEKVVDRLIMKGRVEEYNSRQLLQQKAINDLVNEFVEYLVIKIKVQEIIQQQGTAMAGDVAGEFQEQSANVDELLEDKLKSIFRRNPSNPPGITPENTQEGGEGR